VLVVAVLIISMVPGLLRLSFDTSNEGLLHKEDPAMKDYHAFCREFGREGLVVVAIEPPDVFCQSFLKRLKILHESLESSFPQITEITSLINAPIILAEADELTIESLLKHWPRNTAEMLIFKRKVMDNALYRNRLISNNGRLTIIIININTSQTGIILSDDERNEVVRDIRTLLAKYQAEDFKIFLAGAPVVDETLKHILIRDIFVFMSLSIAISSLCLFLMFRRAAGVILPLLIVTLAGMTTLAAMGYCGVPIKIPTVILPSLVLITGVEDSVFIISLFYRNLQHTGDKKKAIAEVLGRSGLALVLTSLTTAVGLAAFATADIAPVADLGRFGSFGVMMALVYNLTLLPALLVLSPVRSERKSQKQAYPNSLDQIMIAVADFSTRHPKAIAVTGILVIVLSFPGIQKLHFTHNVLEWLPDNLPVRQAIEKIDRELKGTVDVEILLDTGRENGLYDPLILKKLDRLAREIEVMKNNDLMVGKVISLTDYIKEIHRAVNENKMEFYTIPNDRKLIAQELLLLENSGSKGMKGVVDSAFRLARFTITLPWIDTMKYVPFLKEIERLFRSTLGAGVKITVTGTTSLFSRTVFTAIHSAAKSYVIALVTITLLMILLIGNFRVGLVSMLPNLAPVFLTLGIMGWFGIRFDLSTMLVFCITLGLVVDNTIQFLYRFERHLKETGDVNESARKTLHILGQAMIVSSTVIALGFFTFMLSTMTGLFYFGLLSGLIVVLALLADLVMDPALMVLMYGSVSAKS
jgi:uncharacterized protein